MSENPPEVVTIGHSSHSYEQFLALLRSAEVTAVADVRSAPHSRRHPHFNRNKLSEALRRDSITYVFLGDELGGRPSDPGLYRNNVADYERMAATEQFKHGLDRIFKGALSHRIALMCSEHDPLDCHRCLLVGRALSERGMLVRHILADGAAMTQQEIEERLRELSASGEDDLLLSDNERIAAAYRGRALKVAFRGRPAASSRSDHGGPSDL